MLFSAIGKTVVDISVNITDNLPSIKGDGTKLMQLLLNLVKNSLDAIEENTAEKNICVDAYTEANKLILRLKDNGRGFDSSIAGQLFNCGFTTKANGTGQSVYNCKTIVESHVGTIAITSDDPGKGTLTTIRFKIWQLNGQPLSKPKTAFTTAS